VYVVVEDSNAESQHLGHMVRRGFYGGFQLQKQHC